MVSRAAPCFVSCCNIILLCVSYHTHTNTHVCTGLPRLRAYSEALLAHPAVQASISLPDSSRSYVEQLIETYREYVARRKAAAAAN